MDDPPDTTDLEALPMPELFTTQEEADTRLLLHCAHATDYSRHIIIRSPDTDVFVLALAFYKDIMYRMLTCITRQGKEEIITQSKSMTSWER